MNNLIVVFLVAQGGLGGLGGNGLGGGLYNDADSTMTVNASRIVSNKALRGLGAPSGLAVGGGVFDLGTFTTDAATIISGNVPAP